MLNFDDLDAPDLPPPETALFFRRAWWDPLFILIAGLTAFLAYVATDVERDQWLEDLVGYSGTRIAVLLWLVMFLWGTLQGFRHRAVVYINDEITPNYNDTLWTFGIFLGAPIIAVTVWLLLSLGSWLLFPAHMEPPRYDDAGFYLMYALWLVGAIWLYARLYAYNRNALTTTAAFITKLSWCFLACAFFRQAERDLENESGKGTYEVMSNFIVHIILFFMALLVIGKLTYTGPSLRK